MKKALQLILIALFTVNCTYAQPERGHERMARIHAAKMAYLTDRLQLTAKQSGDFVPLYNEYETELKSIRKSYFKKYKGINPSETDDATARGYIDDNLDYQQEVIGLKRRYNERFMKVITAQQLTDLYKAEREFRQILKKRLEERKNAGGR
jgi:hypothetical protein